MKTLARRLWLEPALFLGVLNAAIQFVQLQVLDLSATASWIIAAAGVLVQGLLTRMQVTPVAKGVDPTQDDDALPGDDDAIVAGVPVADPQGLPDDAGDKGSA